MSDNIPLSEPPKHSLTIKSTFYHRYRQNALRIAGFSKDRPRDTIQTLLNRLAKRLQDSSKTKASSHIRRLRRDYERIKDRQAKHHRKKSPWMFALSRQTPETQKISSCDKLLYYWLLSTPGTLAAQNDPTNVRSDDTFSEWVCRIAVNLEMHQQNTLQLVSMTESPEEELTKFMFSSWHYFIATVSGRLDTIYQLPVRVLQATVAHFWGIEMMALPGVGVSDALDPSSLSRPKPPRLPSTRLSNSPEEDPIIVWGNDSTRPGNLDPSRGDHEILLTWMRCVTIFDSDLVMYIWEYHKSVPEVEFARIVLRPGTTAQHQPRLLISFRSSRSNELFRNKRNSATKETTEEHLGTTPGDQINWSPMLEASVSISIVFELMIADTAEFLEACNSQVAQINRLGRQSPSTSKMRFLMHLEDCRKMAHHGVRHGLEVLESLDKWSKEKGIASAIQQKRDVLKEDLVYLDQELDKLDTSIRNDKDMLRQHLQLSSDMTSFRLTLLAGIFLPLSFTTSLFGMNIENSTQEKLEALSEFTNNATAGLSVEFRNSTQAIVSSVAKSGPLNHSWTTFAVTSLCVLATLPLTLTIGFIIRSLVVLSAKYIIYWRVALVVLGVPFAFISMFGALIGDRLLLVSEQLVDESNRASNKSTDLRLETLRAAWYYEETATAIFYAFWVCNGPMGLYLLARTWRAWGKKRQRLFWTAVTVATIVCCLVDSFIPYHFAFPAMETGGESLDT
ncbi:hypothetical protein PG987_005979 [Apiospora arundinis]